MRIEDDGTQERDWYAVDRHGAIAQMMTAGFATMPESVLQSEEDNDVLNAFFSSLPIRDTRVRFRGRVHAVADLPTTIAPLADGALQGLFFFDADLRKDNDRTTYTKLLEPINPLTFSELPNHIQSLVSRTCLLRDDFARKEYVQTSEFS